MKKNKLPYHNVLGFASDSACVMIRKRNSVLSRVLQKQPNVFSLSCLCHLTNLFCAAALKKLPISNDLLIDLF